MMYRAVFTGPSLREGAHSKKLLKSWVWHDSDHKSTRSTRASSGSAHPLVAAEAVAGHFVALLEAHLLGLPSRFPGWQWLLGPENRVQPSPPPRCQKRRSLIAMECKKVMSRRNILTKWLEQKAHTKNSHARTRRAAPRTTFCPPLPPPPRPHCEVWRRLSLIPRGWPNAGKTIVLRVGRGRAIGVPPTIAALCMLGVSTANGEMGTGGGCSTAEFHGAGPNPASGGFIHSGGFIAS